MLSFGGRPPLISRASAAGGEWRKEGGETKGRANDRRQGGLKTQCALLRSGVELGDSEHTFGLRLIAVQPFISLVIDAGLMFSSIGRTGAENGSFFMLAKLSSCRGSLVRPEFVFLAFSSLQTSSRRKIELQRLTDAVGEWLISFF